MKKAILFSMFCLLGMLPVCAQNDYIVSTAPPSKSVMSEEEQFVYQNFPMRMLCDWTLGMRFMFMPEPRDMFMPVFNRCSDNKSVDSGSLKTKIFEFQGIEEVATDLHVGTTYTTRFIFKNDTTKYFHAVKGMRIDEICVKNPRAFISGLVYLGDVDTARQLLIGRSFYTKSGVARVDDPSSFSGWKEVNLPENTRVTVTNVGVGSQAFPVKIIFQDPKGTLYYLEEAFSRTNSGLDVDDFQSDKKNRYFANAFSLNDRDVNTVESIRRKYINMPVYPKENVPVVGTRKEVTQYSSNTHLLRYTPLRISDIAVELPSTKAVLTLEDLKTGRTAKVEVDLKYNVVIKNSDYFDDLFAYGDIRKKYPYITEADWKMIAMGEIKPGMTGDECRLAIGDPAQIEIKRDSRFESWIYPRRILEFESGRLLRTK